MATSRYEKEKSFLYNKIVDLIECVFIQCIAACLFQHLKRVKKTTKKVETEADLSGFVLLDESEQ